MLNNNPLISFMVIGAAKSGTSALHRYMVKHPDVGGGKNKELHFFDDTHNFFVNNLNYDEYHQEFDFSSNKQHYGDFTPDYIYFQESARLIWRYNRNIKLIILLRNPIERAFSHWNMETKYANVIDTLPFGEAIRNERFRLRTYLPEQHGHFSYIDRGFYTEQLRRFKRLFPDEQLLILKYDDFKNEQEKTLRQVFEFIGVDPNLYQYEHQLTHYIPYHEKLSPEDHLYLLNTFQHEIHALEQMLGWDCSAWLKPPTTI
jgi:hypothetical protein